MRSEGCTLEDLPEDPTRLKLLYDNAVCTHDTVLLVQCCVALVLCLLVIVVNTAMIVTLIRHKALHNTTNWLLLSLAFSDCLFGLSSVYTPVMTVLVITAGMNAQEALLEQYIAIRSNKYLCLTLDETGLAFATMTASLLSLVVLAAEKYIAVFHPLKYHQYMTPCVVRVIAIAVWASALIFGFMPLVGWNNFEKVCVFVNKISFSYVITWSAICLAGLVVVFVLYLRIFLIARKHARQIRQTLQYLTQASVTMADPTTVQPITDHIAMGRLPRAQAQQHQPITRRFTLTAPNSPIRAVKTVAIILGVFYICWLPLLIYFLVFPGFYSSLIIKFLMMVALFNSLCNPFIYGVRNKAIRRAIFCCSCKSKSASARKAPDDVRF